MLCAWHNRCHDRSYAEDTIRWPVQTGALSGRLLGIFGGGTAVCLGDHETLGRSPACVFGVGAARSTVTFDRWWRAGFEMLGLGIIVAAAAYGAGALMARLAA